MGSQIKNIKPILFKIVLNQYIINKPKNKMFTRYKLYSKVSCWADDGGLLNRTEKQGLILLLGVSN
jgi:hypothetical protein